MSPIPVPADVDLARADALIRELYGPDLRSAAVSARPDVAKRLLADALAEPQAASEYVLLREAARAAVMAGDTATITAAFDRSAARFGADRIAQLVGLNSSKIPADVESRKRLEALMIAAADDAAKAENLTGAIQLLTAAEEWFRKAGVPDVAKRIQARLQSLQVQMSAARASAQGLATLAQRPDDPAANLAVGRYLCLFQDQWESGLPRLAKGLDAPLKALAERELTNPTDGREQVAMGGAWWDYAATPAAGENRRPALLRARTWYLKGRDNAGGLAKVLADKRIAQIEAEFGLPAQTAVATGAATKPAPGVTPKPVRPAVASKPVDLLAPVLANVSTFAIAGQWSLDKTGRLTCGGGVSRLEFPADVPDEYDFAVEFIRPTPGADFVMCCAARGTAFSFCAGGNGGRAYALTTLAGRRFQGNPTMVNVEGLLAPNERHRAEVRVRADEVVALLDGKELIRHKTDFTDLKPDGFFATRDKKRLGIASWSTPMTILAATVTPVGGKAAPADAPVAGPATKPAGPVAPIAPIEGLRTVVFVIDAGESMKEELPLARAEMRKALANLEDGQGFNVILVQESKAVPYRPGRLVGMSAAERDACLAWLDAAQPKGAGQTDIYGGVRAGLVLSPSLLYLISNFDLRSPQIALPKIRDANKDGRTRVNAIVVGATREAADAYVPLAKQLASDNRGLFKVVTPD